MAPLSPTVARWELMRRIRRRRNEFDVSASVVAKELGFTLSYWSKVEKERVLAEDKLKKLMRLLEFDPAEREEMLRLRDIAKQRGWWSGYAGLLSDEVTRLYGLSTERSAFTLTKVCWSLGCCKRATTHGRYSPTTSLVFGGWRSTGGSRCACAARKD